MKHSFDSFVLPALSALVIAALIGMSGATRAAASTISFDCAVDNGMITSDTGGCEFDGNSVSFGFSFSG